jgi:branched-chain amino acid transport system permease protein
MPTKPLTTRYEDDLKLFPDRWHKVGLALAALVAVVFPVVADGKWITVGNLALLSVVGSVGLMILTGFAGQISLGHAAFLAVGAYTAAILGVHWGVPFWLCLPAAGLLSAAVGLAVGPFALRLRGLYLAIVTLGLIFIVNHTLLSLDSLTNGVSGIAVPMHWWFAESGDMVGDFGESWLILGWELDKDRQLYIVFLILAVLAGFASKNIQRSNTGRAMVAVRDHDIAAAVLGVHPARAKIVAFGVSSFFTGIAGAMFAFQQQYITVEPPFDLNLSVQYIAIIVIGGIGTTFGAIAGAFTYTFLGPLAELVGPSIPFVNQLTSAQQSTLLFAVLVCLFLIVEPLGMLGIWLRIKRYFVAWPFRY